MSIDDFDPADRHRVPVTRGSGCYWPFRQPREMLADNCPVLLCPQCGRIVVRGVMYAGKLGDEIVIINGVVLCRTCPPPHWEAL